MQTPLSHLRTVGNRDGAVILDLNREVISTLNATGAYVWQGLQHGETPEAIIANLVRETGEDPLRIDRDVRQFIAVLEQEHLLPN